MPHIIEEIRCKTYDEFIEMLRPSNDIWDEYSWVFRGLGNHEYELLPTLFRSSSQDSLVSNFYEYYKDQLVNNGYKEESIRNQNLVHSHPNGFNALIYHNVERHVIYQFAKITNDAGLPIPDLIEYCKISKQ